MRSFEEIHATLERLGQGHLLRFYSEIEPQAQRRLLEQIDQIDPHRTARLAEEMVLHPAPDTAPGRIEPPLWYPRDPADPLRPYDAAKYRRIGEDLIRSGKVACFCVAGGQGTRLGWDGPKGTFPATPILKKPLFQVFAESIALAQIKYACRIPLYIMTSPLNHGQTTAFFNAHDFFGLDPAQVRFFVQGVMPSFDAATGRVLLSGKGELALSPDGHGGSIRALAKSGALADMKDRGIRHISYFQVDNPLVKVVDPLFLGLHAAAPDSSGEMSSKMVLKTGPTERVGNFCRINGRTAVIEYSDLDDSLAHQKDERGNYAFRAGSIAIHCISTAFVERLSSGKSGVELPFHRALKKVPHINLATGTPVEPTEPNAIKLEQFIFDALPLCESSIILETERAEEFAPIKNATGVDSAESSIRLQIDRAARWLEHAGVTVPRRTDGAVEATIEISPLSAIEPQDLSALKLPERIEPGAELVI